MTALAQALADYRVKTDLEINNERIARQQLGVDLNTRVDDFVSTFDHKFVMVYQTIQTYQDETNGKLTLFDARIRKYEEMLQDITTDSIQITMDNGEINMGAWTILSQAREWDLEILANFKDYKTQTDKDIDEALKDIQDKLPIEQDIIDKAIEALSDAQIIKDLDAKIDGNIADIDTVHQQLIAEVNNRQNEMIDYSQTIANEMQKNQNALVTMVQTEAEARIDALQRESAIRQQELVNEAAERSAEITERIKDIEAGTGADLTAVNQRIDEANLYIESVKDTLDTERDERLADIATLDDGLTKEIQSRKDGDTSITTALNNYKASNDVAMANFRDEVTVVAESNAATVTKVNALDASLKTTNTKLDQTTATAGTALDKATLALTETGALAQRVTQTEANITQINKDVATKANASTVTLLESRVETIDGEVKASTKAITKLTSDLTTVQGELDQKVDASVLDSYSTTVQTDKAIADRVQEYDANLYIGGQNIWSVVDQPVTNEAGVATKTVVNQGEEHYRIIINSFASNRIVTRLDNALVDRGFIFKIGDDFTVSFEVRASRNAPASGIYYYFGGSGSFTSNLPLTTEWVRYVFPLKATGTGVGSATQMFGTSFFSTSGWAVDDWVEFRHVQMQRGKKATEFQKATAKVQQGITTNATAITGIKAEVTNHEGRITSNSNSITALTNTVSQTNKDLATKADSKAVADLKSQVDVMDGKITSNSQSIVILNNDVTTIKGDMQNMATTSALQALDSKVSVIDGKTTSNTNAITSLQGSVNTINSTLATKADTSAVNALSTTVTQQGTQIIANSNQLTNLSASISMSMPEAKVTGTLDGINLFTPYINNSNINLVDEATAVSGKVIRIGDNSGNDNIAGISNAYVAIDPNKLYRVKYRVRRVIGDGTIYLSVVTTNADKTRNVMHTNSETALTDISNSLYYVGNAAPALGTWLEGEYFFKGKSAGTSGGTGTIASPRTFPAKAAYIRLGILPNFTVKAGQQDIDYIILEDYDAMSLGDANGTAITNLGTRVTNNEGAIDVHSSQLTNLTGRISTVEGGLTTKADSSALSALETKVTAVDGKVSTNTNAITSLQGRVTSVEGTLSTKADASALANYYTKTQTDSAVAGGINAYNTSLSVGGDNLWSLEGSTNSNEFGVTQKVLQDSTIDAHRFTVSSFTTNIARIRNQDMIPNGYDGQLAVGEQYTLTFKIRASRAAAADYYAYVGETGFPNVTTPLSLTEDWQTITSTFTLRATVSTSIRQMFCVTLRSTNGWAVNDWYDVKEIMLQRGNKATTYVKAAAKTKQLIDANASAITNTQASVTNLDGKLTTLSTSVTTLTGRVSTVENGLSTKADVSAFNALDARVVQQGKDIETVSASVTTVNTRIDNLAISTNNVLLNSYGERTSAAPTQREYLMYERSVALKDFYNENLDKFITLSFEIKVPVAGPVQVYTSNNSAHQFSTGITITEADVWQKFTLKLVPRPHPTTPENVAGSTLEFYGTYGTGRIPTIRKAMMVAGGVAAAWEPSPRDTQASFEAQSSAISTLDSQTKALDGRIITNASNITTLQGRVTTAEGKITSNTNAISGLETKITETNGKIDAQANSVTRLQSRVDNNAGAGLSQDYLCLDYDSWYNHSNLTNSIALAPYFNQTLTDGPLGAKGFAATGGTFFMYNKTPLPTNKTYRVQFWAKRSSDTTGTAYITILRLKPGEALNAQWYTSIALSAAELPRNNTWTYIDKIVNITGGTTTYPLMYLGFSLNNGASAGTTAAQGFKVTEILNVGDTTGLATSDALTSLTTRVTTAEGKIDTQAGQITSLNTTVAGKANASAVTSLEARVTTAEGNITSLTTSSTNLTNRMTAAEGKITTNTNNLTTMTNKVTEIDGKVTAQATQINKVESTLAGQAIGSTNLHPATISATTWEPYSTSTVAKVTGGFKTDLVRVTKTGGSVGGVATVAAQRKINVRTGTPIIVTAKVRGDAIPNYIYMMGASGTASNVAATSIEFSEPFGTSFVTMTVKFNGNGFGFRTNAWLMMSNNGAASGTWFEFAELMVQDGNTATAWSDSYLDVPEIDLTEYAKASALSSLDTKVTQIDGRVTSQATSITQLQSSVGDNTSKLQVQGEVIDGLKASYFVKTDVNGLVAGFGLYNDGTSSAFGVNADYFYIGKASGGKKPFIVTTSPQTIDGVTYPVGTWIHTALIANATIGTAHIADASITNAKINSLDAAKITTGTLDAARIKVGAATQYEIGYDPITKARTFVAQPVTPYRAGDIWKNGTTTAICTVTRLSGAYVAADWGKTGDVTSENTAADTSKVGGVAAATVNQNITNAQTAATNAATLAGNKGEVIYGTAQPAADKRLAQNLWIDTTSNANTPKRWNGSAWVAVTDKAATDAKAAADAADAKAVAAQVTANSANNQVNAWKFTGTTEIDGGKIRADTVTAVQMNVAELSAITGTLGTLVTYKDPAQPNKARMVMQGSLITVYDDNNVLRVRMGLW
ncbi:tail fiber [Acinetobacter phage nACB1]|nr:tail fiber [Acinetobacter phage nACB1]